MMLESNGDGVACFVGWELEGTRPDAEAYRHWQIIHQSSNKCENQQISDETSRSVLKE
jgi:hypothetical protein